jgi:hypothetical protein
MAISEHKRHDISDRVLEKLMEILIDEPDYE